jgi:hypothetical protein
MCIPKAQRIGSWNHFASTSASALWFTLDKKSILILNPAVLRDFLPLLFGEGSGVRMKMKDKNDSKINPNSL